MAKAKEIAHEINAMPTKELFIDMLTRDIELIPTILDLIDNSIDGAKRVRTGNTFKGYSIEIKINQNEFSIIDNCGGIDLEIAEKYAFRFGRPVDAPSAENSVGRFGIGMKRALFKLGKEFQIKSTATRSFFILNVNVDSWAAKVNNEGEPIWKFDFSKVDDSTKHSVKDCGTEIHVKKLKKDVANDFSTSLFAKSLMDEIRSKLHVALVEKIEISVNGKQVTPSPVTLLQSSKITPARYTKTFKDFDEPIQLEMYCGIAESDPEAAGWNVYCNGRLVMEADKTSVTGWGETHQGEKIPEFHGQFNYFRGYVYFESESPDDLPWNTTKTGVDADSPVYRFAKQHMTSLGRPVIDFLNKLKDEKGEKKLRGGEEGPLEKLVSSAGAIAVQQVSGKASFSVKEPKKTGPKKVAPDMERITYDRPRKEVEAVKKKLKLTSNKEVGEETFNYFIKSEMS